MHQTPKTSFYLVVISASCAGLLFFFANSVRSQEVKNVSPQIKELQQRRLAILEKLRDSATRLFQNARVSYDVVESAESELLVARLAYTVGKEDRIKVCDEAIEHATKCMDLAKKRKEAAKGTELDELKAQAFMIEAQILRENAMAAE